MRSYERQGLDVLPTVHMGATVSVLEQTNIANLNRDIKAANRMMNAIRGTIRNLQNWIADIMEARKPLRKATRTSWTASTKIFFISKSRAWI
jgi:hypothetical protein